MWSHLKVQRLKSVKIIFVWARIKRRLRDVIVIYHAVRAEVLGTGASLQGQRVFRAGIAATHRKLNEPIGTI